MLNHMFHDGLASLTELTLLLFPARLATQKTLPFPNVSPTRNARNLRTKKKARLATLNCVEASVNPIRARSYLKKRLVIRKTKGALLLLAFIATPPFFFGAGRVALLTSDGGNRSCFQTRCLETNATIAMSSVCILVLSTLRATRC